MSLLQRLKNLWRISGVNIEIEITKEENIVKVRSKSKQASVVDLEDPLDNIQLDE